MPSPAAHRATSRDPRAARVWEQVCRYADGMVMTPTMAALERRGVLQSLLSREVSTFATLRETGALHEGFVHVALRLMASQGWIERDGEPGTSDMTFTLRPAGRTAAALGHAYVRANGFLPEIQRIASMLRGGDALDDDAEARLQSARDAIRAEWGVRGDITPVTARHQVLRHCDGLVVGPLMSALSARGAALLPRHGTLQGLLADLGWLPDAPEGTFAARFAPQFWHPAGYLSTLAALPELLFGDPRAVHPIDAACGEAHLDRALDIQFSGGVFDKTCREPFLSMALPLFDAPVEMQPAAIVDTGCGNGQLLRVLYEAVRARTARGRELDRVPLAVIGVEPSRVARDVARQTLAAAGIPHEVIDGDITNPDAIAASLAERGLDPFRVLHLSKSVVHNRRYTPPPIASSGPARSTSAFATPDGGMIPNAALEQNLIEHLARWRPYARRSGMIVIEAHTVAPRTAAALVGRTIATVLDATHGYSCQYPVEPDVFAAAARDAGLQSIAHHDLGAATVGHPVLTLDHFVAASA